ncbi:hypothetical protein ACSCB1_00640 [Streptomyces europaeiscabiei]|uniref:hypothetical protein n=1 Tax=Streptomyces europaeiscabiei TaxID=146819 RepID=UPI0006285C64|nr:hypothetical protein [Streptomyces europaeiscabiei]
MHTQTAISGTQAAAEVVDNTRRWRRPVLLGRGGRFVPGGRGRHIEQQLGGARIGEGPYSFAQLQAFARRFGDPHAHPDRHGSTEVPPHRLRPGSFRQHAGDIAAEGHYGVADEQLTVPASSPGQ